MINFNDENWNEVLGKRDWEKLETMEDLDDLVKQFTELEPKHWMK